MQFTTTFLPLLALALPTSAIITGVTAPATITAGEPFQLTLTTADYIQSVYDISAAFGITPGKGNNAALGNVFASAYLGPQLSNILYPIRFTVTVDASTPKGNATIAASVSSLYGIENGPATNVWNTTVTVQ